MARRLTKEAIAYIIECRDDPTQINTWQDIADLVAEKFDIRVTFQAIAKSYAKNKDKPYFNNSSFLQQKKSTINSHLESNNIDSRLKKPKQASDSILKKFDNNDVKLDDFF